MQLQYPGDKTRTYMYNKDQTNWLSSIKGLTVRETENLVLWLKTGTLPDNPGYTAITSKCREEIEEYLTERLSLKYTKHPRIRLRSKQCAK